MSAGGDTATHYVGVIGDDDDHFSMPHVATETACGVAVLKRIHADTGWRLDGVSASNHTSAIDCVRCLRAMASRKRRP